MPNKGLSKDEIEQLKKYDSPTVCNVIELFDVRPRDVGYMKEHVKCCFPEMPPMVGYASTAMRRCASAPSGGGCAGEFGGAIGEFRGAAGSRCGCVPRLR